uniref:Uncharacterized protein n=1 Tax=Anopheles albimanus TaxID=7167 RepID=A0A182FSD1_ANOAL
MEKSARTIHERTGGQRNPAKMFAIFAQILKAAVSDVGELRVVQAKECARLKDICHPSNGASPNGSSEERRLEPRTTAIHAAVWAAQEECLIPEKEFTEDCVFNEQMEQHHYNTYSSTQHSNARRTLYLALNKTGQPRKIQIPVNRMLGKLATYTKALTQTVAHDRVEQLISRLFGADHVRHGLNQLCEAGRPLEELTEKELRPRPACGAQTGGPKAQGTGANGGANKQSQTASASGKEGLRQTKKKKKRRKCRDDEVPGEQCFRHGGQGAGVKMAASGGNRSGNAGANAGGSGSSQTRKPKKPAQQQQQQPAGPGKRNGTAGNQGKAPGSGKSKLVPVSSMVISKVSPKPASLLSGRTPRNTTPFPTTTTTSAVSTISAAVNHLEDTSQQLDDLDPSPESELETGDALQPSAELVDEDELDEGNLNLAGHAINFVEEEDLDDLEF